MYKARMSVTQTIFNRMKHMRKVRPFAGSLILGLGSRASVHKALSRLVQTGARKRVAALR